MRKLPSGEAHPGFVRHDDDEIEVAMDELRDGGSGAPTLRAANRSGDCVMHL